MSIIERLYNKKSDRTGLTTQTVRTYLTSETLHLTSSGKDGVLVRTQRVVVPADNRWPVTSLSCDERDNVGD